MLAASQYIRASRKQTAPGAVVAAQHLSDSGAGGLDKPNASAVKSDLPDRGALGVVSGREVIGSGVDWPIRVASHPP